MLNAEFRPPEGAELDDVVVADVLLVTSELVTNAIRHGGGLTGFAVEVRDGGLHLAVSDASSEQPALASPDPSGPRIGGYGWRLVCRLAQQVSVIPHSGGKHITALLALT